MEEAFLISTPFKSVMVHPVVPFMILDQYIRRTKGQDHVMGTIMGTMSNGVLEITNCFSVGYTFNEEGLDDEGKQFNETLSQLHATANKSEVILGWFSTVDSAISANKDWYFMNDYYRSICQAFKPIFLTVDVSITGDEIAIEAYSVTSIIISGNVEAIKLTKLPVELSASTTENQVIQSLVGIENQNMLTESSEVYNDLGSLKYSMEELMIVLEESEVYIEKVMAGEIKPTIDQSRKVFGAIASVPSIPCDEFKKLFKSKLQDFALVSHLSSLARREVELAEKMNKIKTNHHSQ